MRKVIAKIGIFVITALVVAIISLPYVVNASQESQNKEEGVVTCQKDSRKERKSRKIDTAEDGEKKVKFENLTDEEREALKAERDAKKEERKAKYENLTDEEKEELKAERDAKKEEHKAKYENLTDKEKEALKIEKKSKTRANKGKKAEKNTSENAE